MTVGSRDEKAESFAHSTVPADATGSASKIFFIVAGSLCGLPVFVLSSGVTAAVGFRTALLVFCLGTTVAATLGAASALSGARTRMTLALLAETTFGVWGAQLVQLAIALSLFGWFGVIVSVLGATAASAIFQVWGVTVPPTVISLPLCAVITLIARRGVDGLGLLAACLT
jgi:cytosine permease